eukprot:1574722-Prymnesium_polylepis.1
MARWRAGSCVRGACARRERGAAFTVGLVDELDDDILVVERHLPLDAPLARRSVDKLPAAELEGHAGADALEVRAPEVLRARGWRGR